MTLGASAAGGKALTPCVSRGQARLVTAETLEPGATTYHLLSLPHAPARLGVARDRAAGIPSVNQGTFTFTEKINPSDNFEGVLVRKPQSWCWASAGLVFAE